MAISSNGVAGLKTGVCTSTTRPSGPYEGQMIYETDTDMVSIWNGSAWRYLASTTPTNGSVLQVVSNSYTTETSTTSASWVTTGLNATITPKSTSSKVMIFAQVNGSTSASTNNGYFTIFRGTVTGTNLGAGGAGGGGVGAGFGSLYTAGGRIDATMSMSYLDSPSTSSAQIYTIGMYAAAGITFTAQKFGATSTITLMEIAG
jgi:hypothetical protein